MRDVYRTFVRAFALLDRGVWRQLGLVAIFGVLIAALDFLGILLLVPFLAFLGPSQTASGFGVGLVERVVGSQSQEEVVVILAVTATALFIVRGIGSVVLLWIQNGLVIRGQVNLAGRLLSGFVRSPWLVQQRAGTGAVMRTARESTAGIAQIANGGISALADVAVAVSVFVALVLVNPLLAIGALIYLGAAGLVYLRLVRRPVERRGERLQVESLRMNAALIELVGGIRELTIRGSAQVYVQRYLTAGFRFLSAYRLITVANLAMRHLLEILMIGGAALVILLATLSGSTTVLVSIGVLLAGGLRLVPSLNMLLINVNLVRSQEWALRIVEADLERFCASGSAGSDSPEGVDDLVPSGAFAFSDVTFRYPTRDEPALQSIDLEVGFGETLGLVGASGSGKSTLVDLLLGFLEPNQGAITVDGLPLADHLVGWRAQIGFVPQEIFLVDDTLSANVAFGEGEEEFDQKRIAAAVRLAHLEDVIAELPDGLETLLGERGVMLSGGQRQRVGLARALYRKPRVLILDEATSALDNETERRINEALQSLHGELTMVIIAHRLSTVRSCDRIVYLEEGRISGIGTFEELNRTNPGFARLVELASLEGAF